MEAGKPLARRLRSLLRAGSGAEETRRLAEKDREIEALKARLARAGRRAGGSFRRRTAGILPNRPGQVRHIVVDEDTKRPPGGVVRGGGAVLRTRF